MTVTYPKPGTLVGGKYRVERTLGEGGMAIVVLATHLDLERPVAIKVLRPEYAQREEIVTRMLFEARAAARLRNEHVVRVLDVARLEDGTPYIVLEYLEGFDLGDYLLQHGALPVPLAVNCILQACEALAEAHALGIVHRDLKPENLFVTSGPGGAWQIKVLDFGVSKYVREEASPRTTLTNPSAAVGSPHYMSPEQMRVEPDLDARADIWSLGAILFELITGRAAFEAETIPSVCGLVLEGRAQRLKDVCPNVPRELSAVVARCLSRERERRYPDVARLAAALVPWGGPTARPQAERVSIVEADAAARSPTPTLGVSPRIDSPIPLTLPARRSQRVAPRKRRWPRALPSVALVGLVGAGAGVAVTTPLAAQWAARTGTSQLASFSDTDRTTRDWRPSGIVVRFDAAGAPQEVAYPRIEKPAARRVVRTRPPRVAESTDTTESESQPASVDPWNPEEFGGRR